jgi:Uma2 family endonuclease
MTTDEMLAMPQDGMDRWLIRGQLREKPMTVRNRWHSRVMARLGQLLVNWLDRQPEPRGDILGGEAGVRVRRDPDTTFGIDVVYIGPELAAQESVDVRFVDGVPVLAVEILSPNDTVVEIAEKVDEYLEAGVPLVWIADPHRRTVLVYRPDAEPVLFNVQQELSAEPHLPGFRIPVAQIFTR